MGRFGGSILVHYALGFAGCSGLGRGVVGWWGPGVIGVCLSDFLYDLWDFLSSSPVRVYRRCICESWCAWAWVWRRTGIVP